jgi:hypothetical protein
MKRQILGLSMAMVFLTAPIVHAEPKGATVSVKGEAIDMWCYMEGGDHGASHKACATECAKAGNPIGILDARGDIYLTAGLQDHQPARDLLLNKMSEQVTVTGTLVTKGGTRMLFVKSVK